jgi:hypothetical protein
MSIRKTKKNTESSPHHTRLIILTVPKNKIDKTNPISCNSMSHNLGLRLCSLLGQSVGLKMFSSIVVWNKY